VTLLGARFARDARESCMPVCWARARRFTIGRKSRCYARAANDMSTLNDMVVPGFDLIFDSFTSMMTILVFIGVLDWRLLLVPVVYVVIFLLPCVPIRASSILSHNRCANSLARLRHLE